MFRSLSDMTVLSAGGRGKDGGSRGCRWKVVNG